MSHYILKTALALAVGSSLAACSPMKRLDLVAEKGAEVVTPVEAGESATSTTATLESTSVESIPTSSDTAVRESSFDGEETSSTSDEDGPPPSYPTCPKDKPYPLNNGQCVQCYVPGSSQCWPGYACEIAQFRCQPFCSSNRDCIFRDFSLPICDESYRSCRYCNGGDCGPGLMCSFGQCVPVPPPPESSSTSEGQQQPTGLESTVSPLDAGGASTSDDER